MKRLLLVIAALSLTGCATHAQYKAGYVDEIAGNDCNSLNAERALAEVELERIRNMGSSATSGPARRGVWVYYVDHLRPPGSISYNERRMRSHARQEAIQQLRLLQDCRSQAT